MVDESLKNLSSTSCKYKNEFNRKNYDRLSVMLPKGSKQKLKKLADNRHMSVNKYILYSLHLEEYSEVDTL